MGQIERLADLVVRAGVNVQPGQGVVVDSDTANLEIARAVVEAAYQAGAGWVEVNFTDGPIQRSAVDHASLEELTASRPWALARFAEWRAAGVASIGLVGDSDPHLFDGADPVRVAARRHDEARARRDALFGGMRWSLVAAPNPGWAKQVFGEPDMDRLWAAVSTAMRLDSADPAAEWQARSATLGARAKQLDALELTEVHYIGEGTDLTVGLLPHTRWTGGGMIDADGIPYLPNLPTEEVFTSPDRRRADGTIRVSRPMVIAGQQITGLRVTFKNGRITEVWADEGGDVIRAQIDADEGARFLGEVSLVDRDSRIAKAGIVFHNTLYDENAGCHVAWGQSFPWSVEGGMAMTTEQRAAVGLNQSGVHTDVVIGGDGMTVTGTGPGGTVDIIRDDTWVL
ncbi:aminopeptidase [Paractinoplanes toevensis]|uniref:Leucyl aminopeptidase n=1 Tax=Paractinoplanes toevensis TaxID=571911 RepID=A0A919W4L7_9ACTN|nr:aminopeptidase [Actinoplanes toevensis]GIM90243.1 leucyl aminopeptidase [Actinoplanes toevensis]